MEFISAENVYLDGGKRGGLAVGDRLQVLRNNSKVIAEIEVAFAADFSASCTIISTSSQIKKGDTALRKHAKSASSKSTDEDWLIASSMLSKNESRRSTTSSPLARLSGSAAIQYYQMTDNTVNNLDFRQTTFRINVRAQKLFGKDLTLRLRTRTRQNQRSRGYLANTIPGNEWRNRLYEFSLSFHNPQAPINFSIGRVYSMALSGIGVFDGAQIQANISNKLSAGVLAGARPAVNAYNPAPPVALQKYGIFLNYKTNRSGRNLFQSTLAGIAEYSGSSVSREFIYLQSVINPGAKCQLFQSLELDINRNWRKERAGNSLALSNLYLDARYRFSRSILAGVIFDNRQNYYTIDYREIDDVFFDDAQRTGLRANLTTRLPGRYIFSGEISLRLWEKPENVFQAPEKASMISGFSARLSRGNFLFRRLTLNLFGTRFNSLLAEGFTAGARFGYRFKALLLVSASYLKYNYGLKTADLYRQNDLIRLFGRWPVSKKIVFNGLFEIALGDDLNGPRFSLELGYRF